MGGYGEETCSEFEQSLVLLKRPVTCSVPGCGTVIPAGQRASYTMFVLDGERSATWRCPRCERIYQHLSKRAEGAPSEFFIDDRLDCGLDYEEEWGEPPPPEIAALAFALPGEVEGGR